MALGPVAEAFGEHEIWAASTSVVSILPQALPDVLESRTIALQPQTAVSRAALAVEPKDDKISTPTASSPLLKQMSMLPSESLPQFLADNQTAISDLLASPPAAREVSDWWHRLDVTARSTLLHSAPQFVGNLEGVPYLMRDQANRRFLLATMDELKETIASSEGRVVVEEARRKLHMLEEVREALGSSKSNPQRSLLSLDLAGAGRAAIVLGDLRTADYVSYLIPGMFFTVDGQIGDWTDAAARIYDDQVSWLKLLGDEDDADATVATVAWLGYDTPNLTNVGGLENAYVGRDLIAQAIEGLQTVRKGDEPYTSLLAHSYGSTAALMALTEYDFEIDALAMVGSPGSNAQSVDDLNVRDGNVFVGEAGWDPVPNSAFFGSDPGSESYGAKPMGVGGGLDLITHEVLAGSIGHNEYFGPNTESMRNMALIGIDKGQFVSTGQNTSLAKASAQSSSTAKVSAAGR